MTNLAQQDTGTSASTLQQVFPGNLPLPDNAGFVDVYISLQQGIPVFSSYQDRGPYYSGGICWKHDDDHHARLWILFFLQAGIKGIKSGSPNLEVMSWATHAIGCWVQPTFAHDSFTVEKTDSGSHDPEIVVTPI